MNPFGRSGGDDFFGGGDDSFRGGGDFFGGMGSPGSTSGLMGGTGGGIGRGGLRGGSLGGPGRPMGGGMGRGPMGDMGSGHPRQGGYSSFSSYDSARPQGQQYQEHREPFGDCAGGGGGSGREPTPRGVGGGGRGFMFSGLTRADNPFRRQVGHNPAGRYNPSAQEEPRYQHIDHGNPQYASGYRECLHGQSGGHLSRQPYRQQAYYDESDPEDEDTRPRQPYAPQQAYGGSGARRSGGGSGGGRLFNYDRFGRRN